MSKDLQNLQYDVHNLAMRTVYMIVNKVNGHYYIGSTINYKRRITEHKTRLRRGTNNCGYLQNAWNKYGEENFIFLPLEKLPSHYSLVEREQYYFERYKPVYNIRKIAESNRGIKQSKEVIENRIKKIRKAVIQYTLSNEPIKEWESIALASKELSINISHIVQCCQGQVRAAKGFVFKYRGNFIPFKGKPPTARFSKEELFKFKASLTAKKYKVSDGQTTLIVTNLKEYLKSLRETGLKYSNVQWYMNQNKTDFYKFKNYTVERIDKLHTSK